MDISTTWLVIGVGVAIVLLGILIWRIGRQMAIALLALGVLVVMGMIGMAMLGQANANKETAVAAQKAAVAAQIASAGQGVTGLGTVATSAMTCVMGALLVVTILAAGLAVGVLWLRLRFSEKWVRRPAGQPVRQVGRPARAPVLPSPAPGADYPLIIYDMQGDQQVALPIDPGMWGW